MSYLTRNIKIGTVQGRGRRWGEREEVGGRGGEMTQRFYAHINKRNFKKDMKKNWNCPKKNEQIGSSITK
jgi:hypothetical protein